MNATTTKRDIYKTDAIRIWDQDAEHYGVEWSRPEGGRRDMMGIGQVYVVTGYNAAKNAFVERAVKVDVPLIRKTGQRMVVRYEDLWDGLSKYAYDKGAKRSGLLLIDGEQVMGIAPADAATFLSSSSSKPMTDQKTGPQKTEPRELKRAVPYVRLYTPDFPTDPADVAKLLPKLAVLKSGTRVSFVVVEPSPFTELLNQTETYNAATKIGQPMSRVEAEELLVILRRIAAGI